MKRIITLACCLAVATPFLGGTALGAKASSTKLTIKYSRGSSRFAGKVKSHNHACVAGRAVTVYRKKAGRDPAVGSAKSGGTGRWRVSPGQVTAGDYYAAAPSMQLGSGAGKCAAARTAVTHVS